MNFLKVAGKDISNIFKNRFLRVSVTAIIIVPLLYSLLYLYAFWDPYSKLKDMPVAVVNMDEGTTKDNESVNYGQKVVDKLKDNDKVGWSIVSYDQAKESLDNKGYYAMFVIPKDFSRNVLSAKDGKPKEAKILYKSNDKKNFLASQIDSRVALELKGQIMKSITDEYTKVTFDSLYDIKDGMKKASDGSKKLDNGINQAKDGSSQLKDGLGKLNSKVPQMTNGISKLYDGSIALNNGLNQAYNGSLRMNAGISEFKNKTDSAISMLNSHSEIKNLINPTTIYGTRTLIKDAYMLKDIDTSLLNKVPSILTPQNIQMAKKIGYDFNNVNFNSMPDLSMVSKMLTEENINNVNLLMNDVNKLNTLDMNRFKPLLGILDHSVELKNIMADAQGLASIDMNKFQPIMGALGNTDKVFALMDKASGLSNMNLDNVIASLNAQQQSSQEFINVSNQLNEKEKNIENLISNSSLNDTEKAQVMGILKGYNKLTSETSQGIIQSKDQINGIKNNVELLRGLQQDLVNNSQEINNIKNALSSENIQYIKEIMPKLQKAQQDIHNNKETLNAVGTALSDENIQYIKALLPQVISIKQNLDNNQKNLETIKKLMSSLGNSKEMQENIAKIAVLQSDITKIKPLMDKVSSGLTAKEIEQIKQTPEMLQKLNKMQKDLKNSEKLMEVAKDALSDGNIKMATSVIESIPRLTDGVEQLYLGSNTLTGGLGLLYGGSSQLKGGIGLLNSNMPALAEGGKALYNGSTKLNNGMTKLKDGSKELSTKLKEGYDKLDKNLVNDSSTMGKFVSEPINMQEKAINAVPNYGTGFTPYFIPLSLWVGALMMFFIISDKVEEDIQVSSASLVAGKFLSYGYIGIIQAVLASIVVLALGLKPTSTPLFFLFNIFMSFVFIAIIQSLIFLLGEAGRLLSIVLLILQLTACAGTFPLEVVPKLFKVLNPFMPFTYCVSALREIISASPINNSILLKDVGTLMFILVMFLTLSILMKGHADKVKNIIEERKNSSVA